MDLTSEESPPGRRRHGRLGFGDFVLDTASQQLLRGDDEVPLTPKAFHALTLLVRNAGEVVTKDRLLDEVWADTFVLDGVVKVCIADVRRALGERAAEPRHLHTVQRRGYRFEGPVVEVSQGPPGDTTASARCPRCGAGLARDAVFCSKCGERQQTVPSPVIEPSGAARAKQADRSRAPGERRQLAVMFCEVANRAALLEAPGADAQPILAACDEAFTAIVRSLGGAVAQPLAEGLVACFGYPTSSEDDSLRALSAGLRILESLPALAARLVRERELPGAPQVALRIGVHRGSMEVGGGLSLADVASDAVVAFAARLATFAPPGALVIEEGMQPLVQGAYQLEAVGAREHGADVRALRVLRSTGVKSRLDVADAIDLTPMVGRDQEVALTLERWQTVREGRGRGLLFRGEAGMGKSRLVHALRGRIEGEHHFWMELRGSAFHRNSAFHPVIELLRQAFLLSPSDDPDTQLARLRSGLERASLPVDGALPLFARLLALPLPVDHPLLGQSPEMQRRRTLEMLCAWLFALAEQQPLALIAEDLHWADPSTVELLGMLVEQSPMVPVLMVLTSREEFEPPWSSSSHMTVLPLAPLTHEQVDAMVEHLAGGKRVPRGLREHVRVRADGVPLFVEELTKSLLESDLIEESDRGWERTDPLPELAVPDTLRDSLASRLARLGPAKELAQLAAALGREFPHGLLAAVSRTDPDALELQLAGLLDAGLFYRRGAPPQATYSFKHALIQETAYRSLLPETRKQHHARIARALEDGFGAQLAIGPESIARHYAEAGLIAESIAAYETAGRRANARSAHAEAIAHYRSALAQLAELEEGAERDLREIGLLVAMGEPMVPSMGSGSPEVEAVYAGARALSQAAGADHGLVDALDGLVTFYITQSRLDEAFELAEQQLTLTEGLEDEFRLRAHFSLAIIHYFRGDPGRALDHYDRVAACFDPVAHRSLATIRGENIGAVSRSWCSWALWMRGYPVKAAQAAREGVARARDVAHPWSLAFSLAWSCTLHLRCRNAEEATRDADECIELAERQGFPIPLGVARLVRMRSEPSGGDPDRRIAEAELVLLGLGATGTQVAIPQILGEFGTFCMECGRMDSAAGYIDQALALSQRTGQPHWDAELYAASGDILLALDAAKASSGSGKVEEAEALFHQGLAIAARQQAKMLELRAATRLARLLGQTGRTGAARGVLAEVYEWFEEGFELPDLIAAKELLDTLG